MKSILGPAMFLARSEIVYILRRRETILWTFVMPILFFFFIGSINNSGGPAREDLAVMVPEDAGFLAGQVLARLQALGYNIVRAASPQQFESARRRLEIPAGFTASVLAGHQME